MKRSFTPLLQDIRFRLKFDAELRQGESTPDFANWLRGDGLDPADAEDQVGRWAETCANWLL